MRALDQMLVTRRRRSRRDMRHTLHRQTTNVTGWGIAAVFSVLAALAIFILVWEYSRLTTDLPSIEAIPRQLNAQSAVFTRPTRILDRDGNAVLLEISNPAVQRKYMRLSGVGDTVSSEFVDALLSIQQPDYWQSSGIRVDTLNPDEHPTIAQKLVFQMLLSTEPSDTRRAIRERILALQVLSKFGREQVLEWYINSLDFGYLAYGVEAGAQTYFGKSSASLNLPEASMLAGTAFAPAINPWDSPAGAETLKQEVLKALTSQKKITPAVFNAAVSAKVTVTEKTLNGVNKYPGFNQKVLAQMEKIFGKSRTERGGLIIQTTLDTKLQAEIICTSIAQLAVIEGHSTQSVAFSHVCPTSRLLPLLPPVDPRDKKSIAASVMVVDPQNGDILALIGETTSDGVEILPEKHPAGSSISPFVYLNSFTQGLSPATLVWDVPKILEDGSFDGITLTGDYQGPVSIRNSLVNDYLQPVVTQIEQSGWNSIFRLFSALGLPTNKNKRASEIFVQPLSLDEITSAYAVLAAEGNRIGYRYFGEVYPSLNTIQKVWDEHGVLIWENDKPATTMIISPGIAYLVTDPLSDEVTRQKRPEYSNILKFSFRTAVKIGIVPGGNDTWTVGYTPERLVSVWVGNVSIPSTGSQVDELWSAGLWRAIMDRSMEGIDATEFRKPANINTVTVCNPGGMLPSVDCPELVKEIFVNGTEPQIIDPLYFKQSVNRETGRLATVFTPRELVEEKTFIQIPIEYQSWATKQGWNIAPKDYDILLSPQNNPAFHFTSPEMFSYVSGRVSLVGTASGNDFASYRVDVGEGLNPQSWRQVGDQGLQPVIEGELAEFDTTGLQGLFVVRLQVKDKQDRIQTALLQITVDNEPPRTNIEFPSEGLIINRDSTPELFIKVAADDPMGISIVELIIDNKKMTSWTQAPFIYIWQSQPGEHSFQAIAKDRVGNIAESEVVSITVE